jgi:hypothetical protein
MNKVNAIEAALAVVLVGLLWVHSARAIDQLPTGTSLGKKLSSPAAAGTLASSAGAMMDSDLINGGGTDDTAALQAVLNRASAGRPVHLVIDGAALVSGLNVYGNTTVECVAGGGLYLKDGSNRAILRNAHRTREAVVDQHITVRGCFLNGNRDHQHGATKIYNDPDGGREPYVSNQEADGTYLSGVQFLGVNDLTVRDLTLWKARAFGIWIANGQYIDLRNVRVDNGAPDEPDKLTDHERAQLWDQYANTDGIHFNGPLRYATLSGLKLRTGDDALAFNANDGDSGDLGPYVGQGPITDVTASDIVLMDATLGFRFYSSNQRIDRVLVSNVTGTVQMRMAVLGHHTTHPDTGDFGSITFNNVNVDAMRTPSFESIMEMLNVTEATKDLVRRDMQDLLKYPLFALDSPIENLSLHNITTRVVDGRPLIWVGADAVIQRMSANLSAFDPASRAIPLELNVGGHIGRLSLALDWADNAAGRNPILNQGGTIDELRWMSAPPTCGPCVQRADSAGAVGQFHQCLLECGSTGARH